MIQIFINGTYRFNWENYQSLPKDYRIIDNIIYRVVNRDFYGDIFRIFLIELKQINMKASLIFLFLLPVFSFAQLKPYAYEPHLMQATVQEFKDQPLVEKKDLLVYGLQFLAGAADGANQAIVYHGAGKGRHFWDYQTSWKNKYKDYDHGNTNAAFFGSKTFLVGITDGNHLTRMINRSFTLGSVMIAFSENNKWSTIIKKIIICSLINRVGFTLMYNYILN